MIPLYEFVILLCDILTKKGKFLQEFLGFKFDIISNRRIKNWFVRYNRDGSLTFGFPLHTKLFTKQQQRVIQSFITNNKELIQAKLTEQNQRAETLHKYIKDYITQYPNTLIIFNAPYNTDSLTIQILEDMLFEKCRNVLNQIAQIMQVSYAGLSISYAKSFLGQCTGKNWIKISYETILCSEYCLRYLITHELSHIKHKNHSKNFWNEVETYFPNCKRADKALKLESVKSKGLLHYYNLLPKRLQ